MCMRAPQAPAPPPLPPQMYAPPPAAAAAAPQAAAAKSPDRSADPRDARGSRATDRMRSATRTILTSGSGVTMMGDTDKKTLLGQ